MANKTNWDVSYIDEDGVYHGDVVGNITGDLSGAVTSPTTAYTTDGAITPTDSVVTLKASSVTNQMTLAVGSDGHRMSIVCLSANQTCDVDADFGGTIVTATFTAAGQGIDLVYIGGAGQTGWHVVGNNGASLT